MPSTILSHQWLAQSIDHLVLYGPWCLRYRGDAMFQLWQCDWLSERPTHSGKISSPSNMTSHPQTSVSSMSNMSQCESWQNKCICVKRDMKPSYSILDKPQVMTNVFHQVLSYRKRNMPCLKSQSGLSATWNNLIHRVFVWFSSLKRERCLREYVQCICWRGWLELPEAWRIQYYPTYLQSIPDQ